MKHLVLSLFIILITLNLNAADWFANNGHEIPWYENMRGRGQFFNGKTYIAYEDGTADPFIIVYDHNTNIWSNPVRVGVSQINDTDSHGNPAMLIDSNGFIHVTAGGHGDFGNGKQKYWKSNNPENITGGFTEIPFFNTKITYPNLWELPNGNIFCGYRNVDSFMAYRESSDGGLTWSAETVILDYGGGDDTDKFYYGNWYNDGNDIYFAFSLGRNNVRKGSLNLPTREDIHLMKRINGVWKDKNGTNLNIPLNPNQAEAQTKAWESNGRYTGGANLRVEPDGTTYIGALARDYNTGVVDNHIIRVAPNGAVSVYNLLQNAASHLSLVDITKNAAGEFEAWCNTGDNKNIELWTSLNGTAWNKTNGRYLPTDLGKAENLCRIRDAHPDAKILTYEGVGAANGVTEMYVCGESGFVGTDGLPGNNGGNTGPNGGQMFNGNEYKLITTARTWADAKADCEAMGGHLVTIANQAENDFVASLGNVNEWWIGLTDELIEGNWQWVTGENAGFLNWLNGEPNDWNAGEDYALMVDNTGAWADAGAPQAAGRTEFYVCEWEATPTQGTSSIHSVSNEQAPNVAENLLDGDTADDSRWSASGFPQWVIIDNGPNPAAYDTIKVWTFKNRAYQYQVWGSDDLASVQNEDPSKLRVDRSNNTDNGQPITDPTSGYPWRYLKFKFTGASGYGGTWVSITEIELSNSGSGNVPTQIAASEDAHVQNGNNKNNNYGGNAMLLVKNSNAAQYDRQAFVKFDLSALTGPVSNATLSFVIDSTGAGSIQCHQVNDDTWSENTITWNNKPGANDLLDTTNVNNGTTELLFDVTAYVNAQQGGDGTASFRIWEPATQNFILRLESKEGTNAPLLVITP